MVPTALHRLLLGLMATVGIDARDATNGGFRVGFEQFAAIAALSEKVSQPELVAEGGEKFRCGIFPGLCGLADGDRGLQGMLHSHSTALGLCAWRPRSTEVGAVRDRRSQA